MSEGGEHPELAPGGARGAGFEHELLAPTRSGEPRRVPVNAIVPPTWDTVGVTCSESDAGTVRVSAAVTSGEGWLEWEL